MIWILVAGVLVSACETTIYPTLESAAPVLIVDAWVNNKPEAQEILLTYSQGYFDASTPPPASGATVTIAESTGKIYAFSEDDKKPGRYVWKPGTGETFGSVGNSYKLTINYNGETFEAQSHMGRVPPIDSITFDQDKRIRNNETIYRAEFWATDPPGIGDAYWIRSYKNGVLLNKPSDINIAYDASFSAGGATDGVQFITPIRRGINPNDNDANGNPLSPFLPGDSVNVQILSVTQAAFEYLTQVTVQTDRPGGFQELFARPLANVSTNIVNAKSSGSKALGFFNISAVSIRGKRFKQ